MRYHELMVEEVDDEFDFGEDDPIDQPSPLDWRQQRMLDRYRQKQNRGTFRTAERKRREREEELYSPAHDYYGTEGSRNVPKSLTGYRPFKWPMIRFGLFRNRSMVGFDAEMRRDMGNKTHEPGISCFRSQDYQNGYLIMAHEGRSSWTVGFEYEKMLYPWLRQACPQYRRWQQDGTPMDIFVLRGHLTSYGKNNEWLEVGSDGEYLLNPMKPYERRHLSPDRLWLSERATLQQYYDDLDKRGVPTGEDDD